MEHELAGYQRLQRLWGQAVRAERERQGLSQVALAGRISRDQTTVSKIERGVYKVGPELMFDLAIALEVDLRTLFEIPVGAIDAEVNRRRIIELERQLASQRVA